MIFIKKNNFYRGRFRFCLSKCIIL